MIFDTYDWSLCVYAVRDAFKHGQYPFWTQAPRRLRTVLGSLGILLRGVCPESSLSLAWGDRNASVLRRALLPGFPRTMTVGTWEHKISGKATPDGCGLVECPRLSTLEIFSCVLKMSLAVRTREQIEFTWLMGRCGIGPGALREGCWLHLSYLSIQWCSVQKISSTFSSAAVARFHKHTHAQPLMLVILRRIHICPPLLRPTPRASPPCGIVQA